jgi:hypothetical protein
MTRRFLLLAVLLVTLVALLLGSGAPLASSEGFTWDSPHKTMPHPAKWHPHGWKWL